MQSEELLTLAQTALEDIKARDIKVLDVRKLNRCSGLSSRCERDIETPRSVGGRKSGRSRKTKRAKAHWNRGTGKR